MGLLSITRDTLLAPLGLLSFTHLFVFELLDIVIMAFAIGYIFMDTIGPVGTDPLVSFRRTFWQRLKVAALVAGPAVVLHELSHKIVAMLFGAQATLYAPYGFYLLVTLLKLVGFPFLFFVGGFVAHTALAPLPSGLVAISGPAMNFALYGLARFAIRNKKVQKKYLPYLVPFGKINLLLGTFNLIPLPGFDGWGALSGLYKAFF